jgi:DNA topoisomerase VI subunit B
MPPEYELILGDSYLKSRKAILSYAHCKLTMHKGNRKISLPAYQQIPMPDDTESDQPILLSALQVKRLLRKSALARNASFLIASESS